MRDTLPLPDPVFDRLSTALLTRDARRDRQAWVGVTSTGILCRLTCPARTPKPGNCRFFNRLADGLAARFRPCKRCHPFAAPPGTPFQSRVLAALRPIPAGQTRSYGQVAQHIGQPSATRASARANGANRIALMIPCHRVIGADGARTGYGGELWRKHRLIALERSHA